MKNLTWPNNAIVKILQKNFPPNIIHEISLKGYSTACWDYGDFEIAALLSEDNHWDITGITSSSKTTEETAKRFSWLRFKSENWLEMESLPQYDVVLSVNSLVNYTAPVRILKEKLAAVAQKYMIIVLPFEESKNVFDSKGCVSFSAGNLPLAWKGWSCCFAKVLEIPAEASGDENGARKISEILLVYVSDEHRKETDLYYPLENALANQALLEAKLSEDQAQLNQLQYQINCLQNEDQCWANRFSDMEYHFNRTLNSFCWRITKPIRIISPLFNPLPENKKNIGQFNSLFA